MMENLLLEEGDIVLVKSTSLAKATYVKLQLHTMDFLDISNPKAMLVILLAPTYGIYQILRSAFVS